MINKDSSHWLDACTRAIKSGAGSSWAKLGEVFDALHFAFYHAPWDKDPSCDRRA